MAQAVSNLLPQPKNNFATANSTPKFGAIKLKTPSYYSPTATLTGKLTQPSTKLKSATSSSVGSSGLLNPSSNQSNQANQPPATRDEQLQRASTLINDVKNNYIQPATNTATTVPKKGLFSNFDDSLNYNNLLKQLQGVSKPNKTQTSLIDRMQSIGSENQRIAEGARALSEQYGNEIARVGQLGAGAVAGNLSTGTNVVGSGNAAIASQSASQRMDALSAAQQAALAGTQQQLTAQEQMANAYNNALMGANTQQSQNIVGLSNTANYAQPVQVSPGNTLFTPYSGQAVAGGLGGYVNYNTAEQVMGLISQYPDAGYRYNENLSPQQNLQLAQQAIQQSPTYQRSTFGAPGASSYLGGAQLQTAGTLTGEASQIQAQARAAESNFELLLNIAKQGGVNDTTVPILNTIQRNVQRGAVSSEAVTTFNSVIQSVRSQYAAILGGGTPTDASRAEAASQIPNDISISALQSIMEALNQEANNRVASYQQQINLLQQQSGGSFSGGTGGGGLFDW
jgi:hypothetical protein